MAPKRSNNHHRFPHPRQASYLRSHFALHPPWSWCLWKETQSISAGTYWNLTGNYPLISGHRWLPALRKCSGEPRCCWYLLLRHKPFVESEKRPASLPSKANEYLCVESWRTSTENSLEMPRPEKSWLWKIVPAIFPKWAVEWW